MTAAISDTVPAPDVDADAPYGRKADGTPKKGPGGRPAAKAGGLRARRAARAARSSATPGPTRARRPSTPRKNTGTTDYTAPATGLVQMAAGLLSMVPSEPVKLDALVLHMRAEEIGAVVNKTAQNVPTLAGLLDRFNEVSPWSESLMLLAGIGAQIAVNHRLVSAERTSGFGTVDRDTLLAMGEAAAPPAPPAPEPDHPEPRPEPQPQPETVEPPEDTNGHRFYDVPMPGMPPPVVA